MDKRPHANVYTCEEIKNKYAFRSEYGILTPPGEVPRNIWTTKCTCCGMESCEPAMGHRGVSHCLFDGCRHTTKGERGDVPLCHTHLWEYRTKLGNDPMRAREMQKQMLDPTVYDAVEQNHKALRKASNVEMALRGVAARKKPARTADCSKRKLAMIEQD